MFSLSHQSALSHIAAAVILCGCVFGPAHADNDWPEFRGPSANGIVDSDQAAALPTVWSESENIRWKTPIPHEGWSSPVILDDRVWLTTATADGNDFYLIGVDKESGEVQYHENLFHAEEPEPLGNNVNNYAAPTVVTEAGRVYAHFGTYGTACIDTESEAVLWKREDLECRHYRGPASSPVLFEDLIILTFDGIDVQYVTALEKDTGKTVWTTHRSTAWTDLDEDGNPHREGDLRKGYSTPLIVVEDGSAQMISVGSMTAFSYEPRTGKEIWKATLPGFTPATRPVYARGVVYVTSGRAPSNLFAIKTDGKGDVTKSHVLWVIDDDRIVPQEPSPLLIDDRLYMVSNRGDASCIDVHDGSVLWSEKIGGNYGSSPIYANGLLYFCSTQGKTKVLKESAQFEIVAENRLDTGFMASPAVSGSALYLRGESEIYCIQSAG